MNKEVKLSVNNLKVSFRTDAGKVQAVRDISFDLYKGETLAIVGESGSGKSVILDSINFVLGAIYEGGEILYDGRDLLRIPEEEMHKLRGDKIAMIFQDPLSSLNPMMRIGKQITEAMLLKNKANRKEGREAFNKMLATLLETIKTALAENNDEHISIGEVEKYIKTFDDFNIQAIKLENSYNESRTAAEEMITVIEDLLFLTEKKQKVDVVSKLNQIRNYLKSIDDKYFVTGYEESLKAHSASLSGTISQERAKLTAADIAKKLFAGNAYKNEASAETVDILKQVKATAEEMLARSKYDFFRIGYYVYKHPNEDLSRIPAPEANEMAYKYLTEDFMESFIRYEKIAVRYSLDKVRKNKEKAVKELRAAIGFFEAGGFTSQNLNKSVTAAIDPLAVVKDSVAYTFGEALDREIEKYFFYIKNNPKEEARFARQTAKREAMLAKGKKGKKVNWKIVPKSASSFPFLTT